MGKLLFPFNLVLSREPHRTLSKMVMAMGPVKTGAELPPSVSSKALLFLDLPGSLHTQHRVPKLGQQEKLGGWPQMQI